MGEIASDLKVKYILEGTVRKSNSGLVIQEKVSRTIVDKLKINLTSGEEKLIFRRTVVNVQAYELLMRAKQEMLKFDERNQEERAQLLYNNFFQDKEHLFSSLMDGLMKGIKKDTAGVRSILTDSTFTQAASKDFQYAQYSVIYMWTGWKWIMKVCAGLKLLLEEAS